MSDLSPSQQIQLFLRALGDSSEYQKAIPYIQTINYDKLRIVCDEDSVLVMTKVMGSQTYTTSFKIFVEDDEIASSCTCPAHGAYSDSCKHVAALAKVVANKYQEYVKSPKFQRYPCDMIMFLIQDGEFVENIDEDEEEIYIPDDVNHTDLLDYLHNSNFDNLTDYLSAKNVSSLLPRNSNNTQKNDTRPSKGTDFLTSLLPNVEVYKNRYILYVDFYSSSIRGYITSCKPLKKGGYSSGGRISAYEKMPQEIKDLDDVIDENDRYSSKGFKHNPVRFIQALFDALPHLDSVYEKRTKTKIVFHQCTVPLGIKIEENGENYLIRPTLYDNEIDLFQTRIGDRISLTPEEHGKYICLYNDAKKSAIFCTTNFKQSYLSDLFLGKLSMTKEQYRHFLGHKPGAIEALIKHTIAIPGIQTITDAIPHYTLDVGYNLEEGLVSLREYVKYYYSNRTFEVSSPESPYISTLDGALIQRDIKTENNLMLDNSERKTSFDLTANDQGLLQLPLSSDQAHQLIEAIGEIEKSGQFEVRYVTPIKKITKNTKVTASIVKSMDRFDIDITIEHDEKPISTIIVREALVGGKKYIELPSGTAVSLGQELQKRYSQMRQLDIDTKSKSVPDKISRIALSGLENIAGVTYNFDKESLDLHTKLKQFEAIKEQSISPDLQATLRPYQQLGVNWLGFLHDYGFNGILADDMGLGKTLQTIARLLKCYVDNKSVNFPTKKDYKPTLIICPKSLVYNWFLEIAKFAPSLTAQMIHTRQEGDLLKTPADIYIMSYDTAAGLQSVGLLDQLFYYVILDEAQYIKNPTTLRATAICNLKSLHKLALTGTPIENNLVELRSIFNFLMPGFLGKLKSFQDVYARQNDMIGGLSQKIKPFILRRLKKDVLTDLPDKVEEIVYLEMEESQKNAYENLKNTYKTSLLQDVEQQGVAKMQFAILDALLKMRQMCLHPALTKLSTIKKTQSAKLDYLTDNIKDLIESGHTVLMFSQFTGFLDYVREILDKENLEYSYLDGSCTSKARMQAVDDFNSGKNKIFLISLKAGGTGLNLVAADYVIHLDPRRNPAVEQQATDRAHRIGQSRTVFVQKLIIKDSIEEKILELQQEKKKLIDDVFSGNFGNTLTKDDVKHIFG